MASPMRRVRQRFAASQRLAWLGELALINQQIELV
jgi:hypothetical protein